MMTPRPPRSRKCGRTACEPFIAPSRLSSTRRDWDSSGTSSKRPHMLVPALLTHTSIPPKAEIAASVRSRTRSGSVTSVGTASARPPSSSQSRAACSSSSRRRAARTTLAPRLAKALAVASPMPLEAPVITTVASRRLSMVTLLPSPTLGRRTAGYVRRYYPSEPDFKNLVLGIVTSISPLLAQGGPVTEPLLNLLTSSSLSSPRLMRITVFAPSWACWLDASDPGLRLAEAKAGHLGYQPKGRKVRHEAGFDARPLAAQDGAWHQPGRDALRPRGPQPQRGTHRRQERARARAERGLDALPDARHPGDGRDGRHVEARGPEGGRGRHRPCPGRHKERPPRWGSSDERRVGDRGQEDRSASPRASPRGRDSRRVGGRARARDAREGGSLAAP